MVAVLGVVAPGVVTGAIVVAGAIVLGVVAPGVVPGSSGRRSGGLQSYMHPSERGIQHAEMHRWGPAAALVVFVGAANAWPQLYTRCFPSSPSDVIMGGERTEVSPGITCGAIIQNAVVPGGAACTHTRRVRNDFGHPTNSSTGAHADLTPPAIPRPSPPTSTT